MLRYRYQSIRNGLIGHWRPSRGATGNTLIDSVRRNNGTLTNGPTWQASGSGLALKTDGTNDAVLASLSFSYPISMSIWINTLSSANQACIQFDRTADNLHYYGMGVNTSVPYGYIAQGGGNIALTGSISVSGWSHLCMCSSATNAHQLFVNGRLSGTSSTSVSPVSLTGLTLGAFKTASSFFNGFLDDAAIFQRALTQQEIVTLYAAGRGALDRRINIPVVRGVTLTGSTVTPDTAALTLNAFAPTVATPVTSEPATASLTLTGFSPTVATPRLVTPVTAAVSITTFTPSVSVGLSSAIVPDTAALTLTAFAPSVLTPVSVVPTTASVSLNGLAPTVSVGGSATVTPGTATLTLTAYAPSLGEPGTTWTIDLNRPQQTAGGLQASKTTGPPAATSSSGGLAVTNTI